MVSSTQQLWETEGNYCASRSLLFYLLNSDHNCAYFTGFERIKLENLYKVLSKLHSKEVIPYQHYLQFYLK